MQHTIQYTRSTIIISSENQIKIKMKAKVQKRNTITAKIILEIYVYNTSSMYIG